MRLFVFGLGYSARATARWIRRLHAPVPPVSGTVREPRAVSALGAEGTTAHLFTGERPGRTAVPDIVAATHILVSIPPDTGDPVLTHHRPDLDAAETLEWIGYFSTVGVYSGSDGAWIDESAPTDAAGPRALARLGAEAQWRDFAATRRLPLAIFRLAGIYGPGRSSFDKLRAGTARRIVKPGQVFNRIHVEDIGRITALAAMRRLAGVFNVCDDSPAPPQDVVEFAAGLIGVPTPAEQPFDTAEMTQMARAFYAGNRRCSNAAIKSALGIELLYPSFREGLAAILKETG